METSRILHEYIPVKDLVSIVVSFFDNNSDVSRALTSLGEYCDQIKNTKLGLSILVSQGDFALAEELLSRMESKPLDLALEYARGTNPIHIIRFLTKHMPQSEIDSLLQYACCWSRYATVNALIPLASDITVCSRLNDPRINKVIAYHCPFAALNICQI